MGFLDSKHKKQLDYPELHRTQFVVRDCFEVYSATAGIFGKKVDRVLAPICAWQPWQSADFYLHSNRDLVFKLRISPEVQVAYFPSRALSSKSALHCLGAQAIESAFDRSGLQLR